jgi:thermolysin
MSRMKKVFGLVLCVFFGLSFLRSEYVGKVYFRAADGNRLKRIGERIEAPAALDLPRIRTSRESPLFVKQAISAGSRKSLTNIAREIGKGNLLLKRVEIDRLARMEHRRYTQYYKGAEVLGAQVIQHLKQGRIISTTGEYYEGIEVEMTPLIGANTASQLFQMHLAEPDLTENKEGPTLIIYPVNDGDYRLAYRLTMNKGITYSMTGIVDARSGEVLKEYSNVNYDGLTIGLGTGVHGEQFKLPTTHANNMYWLADYSRVRPVNQITRDYGNSDDIASDADNIWDSDGALVSVHAYVGLTYDYCYSVLGRAGLDDTNQKALIAHVHFPTADIAFWTGGEMFVDTPTAGALDIVAHEYAHGITQYSSGLAYYCDDVAQPGALNEGFSDIIGTAVEFYWQPEGQGFDKADWLIGEDIDPPYIGNQYYGATSYLRDLSDPNSTTWEYSGVKYPYPCHLSQVRIFQNPVSDFGGVHFNSTLYSHAYYLLAAGGTNKVSGLSVSGLGIEKATKIFYRAWTFYLTPTANFLDAANGLLQSAGDLYGASSNEYAQTINAMEAIGWTFN